MMFKFNCFFTSAINMLLVTEGIKLQRTSMPQTAEHDDYETSTEFNGTEPTGGSSPSSPSGSILSRGGRSGDGTAGSVGGSPPLSIPAAAESFVGASAPLQSFYPVVLDSEHDGGPQPNKTEPKANGADPDPESRGPGLRPIIASGTGGANAPPVRGHDDASDSDAADKRSDSQGFNKWQKAVGLFAFAMLSGGSCFNFNFGGSITNNTNGGFGNQISMGTPTGTPIHTSGEKAPLLLSQLRAAGEVKRPTAAEPQEVNSESNTQLSPDDGLPPPLSPSNLPEATSQTQGASNSPRLHGHVLGASNEPLGIYACSAFSRESAGFTKCSEEYRRNWLKGLEYRRALEVAKTGGSGPKAVSV